MPLLKRADLSAETEKTTIANAQFFLFFGDRYLCRSSADWLEEHLLAEATGAVHTIDGELEDPGQTLARALSYSLLPGRQIYRVNDSRIFQSRETLEKVWNRVVQSHKNGKHEAAGRHLQAMLSAADLELDGPLGQLPASAWKKALGFDKPSDDLSWADTLLEKPSPSRTNSGNKQYLDQYLAALEQGLPKENILLLITENVDKRQRLFAQMKKYGLIVDCSVTSGLSRVAQDEQKAVLREIIQETADRFQKTISPQAAGVFLDRLGFQPSAVSLETEKLVHYVGERTTITVEDIGAMVGQNREDALFALSDAFSKRQLGSVLVLTARLLDQGIHDLAILAAMRNYIRRLLICRSLQQRTTPRWHRGISSREFQNSYLPALKSTGEWKDILSGHPYAVYMNFTRAAEQDCSTLKKWLSMLLAAEYKLKGAGLPRRLVLEELFVAMLKNRPSHPYSPA